MYAKNLSLIFNGFLLQIFHVLGELVQVEVLGLLGFLQLPEVLLSFRGFGVGGIDRPCHVDPPGREHDLGGQDSVELLLQLIIPTQIIVILS